MSQGFESILASFLQQRRQSPEQVAPDLGVGHVAIYAWLNGEYQPSNTRIPVLARAMLVSEDRLRSAIARSRRRRNTKKR